MDFESILHVAQRNSQSDKKSDSNKFYSTKFSAPKKVERDKKLSANIQKFLQKKEEEEKEKARQAQQNLRELMALRSEKTKNKIRKMLKVTKSANKSVLADAVDNENTAFTLNGPEQPDEDDYGYVSQEASQLYQQLMNKYKSGPKEEKNKNFAKVGRPTINSDLSSTKDRVRAAIRKEQEEENLPQKRQRQSTSITDSRVDGEKDNSHRRNLYDPEAERIADEEKRREEQRNRMKNRKPPPPAMDFRQLLQLAEKKQFEPVEIEVDTKPKEPERLLTNREKRELEEKRMYEREREKRKNNKGSIGKSREQSATVTPKKMEPNGRIPKLNSSSAEQKSQTSQVAKSNESKSYHSGKQSEIKKNLSTNLSKQSASSSLANGSMKSSSMSVKSSSYNSNSVKPSSSGLSKSASNSKSAINESKPLNGTSKRLSSTTAINSVNKLPNKVVNSSKLSNSTREFPPKDVVRKPLVNSKSSTGGSSSATTSRDMQAKQRQYPSNDKKKVPEKTRPFPPFPEKTRQFPPNDVRRTREPPKKPLKRRVIDDDSEYDSEMDDFIDDGPDDNDYSKHIKEIFGYDRSRYMGMDEDINDMESSFSRQMKEEYISKKIGIMEDLEDMRMEAEEKKKTHTKKRRIND